MKLWKESSENRPNEDYIIPILTITAFTVLITLIRFVLVEITGFSVVFIYSLIQGGVIAWFFMKIIEKYKLRHRFILFVTLILLLLLSFSLLYLFEYIYIILSEGIFPVREFIQLKSDVGSNIVRIPGGESHETGMGFLFYECVELFGLSVMIIGVTRQDLKKPFDTEKKKYFEITLQLPLRKDKLHGVNKQDIKDLIRCVETPSKEYKYGELIIWESDSIVLLELGKKKYKLNQVEIKELKNFLRRKPFKRK